VTLRARWVDATSSLGDARARWAMLKAHWVMLRALWVTLRAHWVMLRARWVTLSARWVTLRARWVTLGLGLGALPNSDLRGDAAASRLVPTLTQTIRQQVLNFL
jgi:predicted Na+-dependent transporter